MGSIHWCSLYYRNLITSIELFGYLVCLKVLYAGAYISKGYIECYKIIVNNQCECVVTLNALDYIVIYYLTDTNIFSDSIR